MKTIELTQGYVALVDDEDFERVNKYSWHVENRSKHNRKYAKHTYRENGKVKGVYLHIFIVGSTAGLDIDHKDHDGLNNQRSNFRITTRANNCHNSRLSKANTSGHKGVYWKKEYKKWFASIGIKGKNKHLGYFSSKEDAKIAYDEAALEMFGEFAFTNAAMA